MPVEPPVTSTVFPSRSLIAGVPFMSWGFGEDRAVDGVHPVRPGQRHRHGHFLRDQVEQLRDARLALRGEGIDPGAAEQHALRAERQHPYDVERSEEHTSELQSLMRISYAVFCLKKKNKN